MTLIIADGERTLIQLAFVSDHDICSRKLFRGGISLSHFDIAVAFILVLPLLAWWSVRVQPPNPLLCGALIVNTGLNVFLLKKLKRENQERERRMEEMMRSGGRRGIIIKTNASSDANTTERK